MLSKTYFGCVITRNLRGQEWQKVLLLHILFCMIKLATVWDRRMVLMQNQHKPTLSSPPLIFLHLINFEVQQGHTTCLIVPLQWLTCVTGLNCNVITSVLAMGIPPQLTLPYTANGLSTYYLLPTPLHKE